MIRKRGKWIEENPESYTDCIKCSICGEKAPFVMFLTPCSDIYNPGSYTGRFKRTKYCPNCGAKME